MANMKSLTRKAALLLCFSCFALSSPVFGSEEGEELKAADAKLNATYQKVMAKMPTAEAKTKLKEAQRAWVAFRDAEIASHAEIPGASGNILKMLQTELTDARTEQLKALAEEIQ